MRFRRSADPAPPPEPDDPRVAALAVEIERTRRITRDWFLLWSGVLLGDGDAAHEATALVRRRWWHFNGDFNPEQELDEIGEESAADLLSWLIGNTMAYDTELMPPERAAAFTTELMSLVPAPRRWFANGEMEWLARAWAGNPATDFTLDKGVVAVAAGRAWIAWFIDVD